jgi:hypothetical protein
MPRNLGQVLAKLPARRRAKVQQRAAELATLKRYVEAMGGKLDLVARFPNRPPVIIEQIAEPRGQPKPFAKGPRTGKRHTAEVV